MKSLLLLEYSHVEQELPTLSENMIPPLPLWYVYRSELVCVSYKMTNVDTNMAQATNTTETYS
jgi:hypothetical protein